jgi:hypothetical protein
MKEFQGYVSEVDELRDEIRELEAEVLALTEQLDTERMTPRWWPDVDPVRRLTDAEYARRYFRAPAA